ncbi:MAG: hypothetical protein KGY70_19105, partial [Bacteroidales bacterium]|nr:hypothetical protein [Bacteroidales bacterium]
STGDEWRIWNDGDAEFQNLKVRGGLQVYELVINRLRSIAGGFLVGPGHGKIHSVSDATAGAEQLYFEDASGNTIAPFSVGMIIVCKDFDMDAQRATGGSGTVLKGIWREVAATQTDGRIDLTTTSGWATTDDVGSFEKGDEVIAAGDSGGTYDANIYMSVTDANSPYLKVMDGIQSYNDWLSDSKTRVQIGNLRNFANYGDSDIFGFFAGDQAGDHVVIDPTNGIRFRDGSYNVLAELAGGSFYVGNASSTNYVSFNGSAVDINTNQFLLDAGSGDLKIDSGNKLISINSGNVQLGYQIGSDNIDGLTIGGETFGSAGIQQDYNSGSPRFYVGNGTDEQIQYDSNGFDIDVSDIYIDSGQLLIRSTGAATLEIYEDEGINRRWKAVDDNLVYTLNFRIDDQSTTNQGDSTQEYNIVDFERIYGYVEVTNNSGSQNDVDIYYEVYDGSTWSQLDISSYTGIFGGSFVTENYDYIGLNGYTKFRVRAVSGVDFDITNWSIKHPRSELIMNNRAIHFLGRWVIFDSLPNFTDVDNIPSGTLYKNSDGSGNYELKMKG